ncbi:hypothetical protein ACTFIZ_008151 [Dictyostelium cf. discoideum]
MKAIYSINYLKFEKQRFEKKKRADTKVKRDIIKHIMLKYPSEIAHLRQLQNRGIISNWKKIIVIGYGNANFNTSSKGDKSSYSNDRLLNIYRTTGFNIIIINEDYTSQRCCKCVIPTEDILMSIYKVLKCTKHHGVINRDDNAFGNMTIKVAHWVYITLKGIEDSVIRSFSPVAAVMELNTGNSSKIILNSIINFINFHLIGTTAVNLNYN